jgi:hypothetical protein
VEGENTMNIKELLQNKINDRTICGDDLLVGRQMSFGKYKGRYVLWLLSKHPFYMKWIVENTAFHLTDVEQWWKEEVETALLLTHVDSIIYEVGKQVIKHGELPESNPHYIVE